MVVSFGPDGFHVYLTPVVHDGDLENPTDPEANFLISPAPQKAWSHACKPTKLVMELNLPKKAMSDVDETGNSYFGFMVIVGMLPADVNLYSGATGRPIDIPDIAQLWENPFGRFVAVAGFGTLPGDLDFYAAWAEF
ncbi:hypothetical protein AK812_SmicGene28011 [Symbiodinium microadriaticum]|uniref:Translation initiation factor beta propellor-like domain-containing protein n=1 Tax=Symbiodinium microadriaticum TaxID=2951 RepID=A0A1Q9D5J9_SYMMI|nr:hypothetical protein AK812_SmicGene28011 [Symbiodinium microadriaticum]